MLKIPPAMTNFLMITAYILLSIFIIMRLFIKKRSRSAICRSGCMLILMLISTIEIIWVAVSSHRSTAAIVNVFNVFLLLFFVRAIREVWLQFMQVLGASVPIFAIIMAYFVIYIIVGFIFFANSQASDSFITINEATYTVFILFTVSNYPDVQTPFFEENRLSLLYFWTFLLIGIFLLSNLLLAQIFLNYKNLIEKKLKRYKKDVDGYFREMFDTIRGVETVQDKKKKKDKGQDESITTDVNESQ